MNRRHNIISKSITISDKVSFKLFYYDTFESDLFENDNLGELKVILSFSKTQDKPFKWPLNLKGLQFLLGVFPADNTVYIASKNLSYELNLIDIYQHLEKEAEINDIVEHAQKIAEIPLEDSPLVIDFLTFKFQLPDFSKEEHANIHVKTENKSIELSNHLSSYQQSLFEKFSDFGLDLTANYELVRVHLLKFLAILPCLDHDKNGYEVKRTFREALRRLIQDNQIAKNKNLKGQKRALPDFYILVFNLVYKVTKIFNARFLAYLIRKSVSLMAKRFIAGVDIDKAKPQLKELLTSNRDATLDQLGELVVSQKEADHYLEKVLEIIQGINGHIQKGQRNNAGINKAHISIKVTALCHNFKSQDFDYIYDQIAPRLKKILLAAKEEEVFINIDAEHYHVRDQVFEIYKKVLLETPELKDYADTGIVVQAYLRDAYEHFLQVVELAKLRGLRMPIRLVKGAYWDAETIEADAHNYEAPQFLNKEETDIFFRQLVHESLKEGKYIQLALASHNIQDHCFAEILRASYFKDSPEIEHQCLHMTYEALSVGLSKMNWATRNYIPIGDLLIGMAYLVRRIMENSSQVGILTIMRSHKKAITYKSPIELVRSKKSNRELIFDSALKHLARDFKNIYPIRTYKNKELKLIDDQLRSELKKFKESNIQEMDNELVSISSSIPDLKLASFLIDNKDTVKLKIEKLFNGFMQTDWKEHNSTWRYDSLSKLADLLLLHRARLSAIIMLEAGKSIDEAIADVDEAIDFINFYIREEINLNKKFKYYQAKGVFGIIAPWNFPLAIPVGMSVAALCSGNTVLLKPSENTPLIANEFLKLARECGITEEIFDLAYGDGVIGKEIVNNDYINGVVFTGSRKVGEEIYQKLSAKFIHSDYKLGPESKTIITEMGGKNAIIVTNNCELDETVSGIIYSAFAHAGQKCSACSRIIIDAEIKDAFLERFKEALRDIEVGSSLSYKTIINPLITKNDQARVRSIAKNILDNPNKDTIVHIDRTTEHHDSFATGPMLVEVNKKLALDPENYAMNEIFGPIVHLIPYRNLDEAIKIFNATDYALTGGIYAQSQDDIDYLCTKLLAGNLYINRPNTGARVAIEPFGGFKMSGTGPKAGSAQYLKSFHVMRKVKHDEYKAVINDIKKSQKFQHIRPSKLTSFYRLNKIKEFVQTVLNRYEVFFQSIDEQGKDVLHELLDYIQQGHADLDLKEFPNRKIPGQLSFDKKDIPLGVGLIISAEDQLDLQQFLTLVFNLIIGNGVSVICTRENGYRAWENIINTSYISGLSIYNVNLIKLKHEDLLKLLKEEIYDFLYIDKHIEHIEDIMNVALKNRLDQKLKKVLVSEEWEDWDNFDSFIENLTHSRSFAVNTMRHGAPLDLSL
jgi:RHH-type proline utilization regulon transcriptional repressor/proline dehydrogenase/delta 1-pyrroline-5-carboxylate dehydrogenase